MHFATVNTQQSISQHECRTTLPNPEIEQHARSMGHGRGAEEIFPQVVRRREHKCLRTQQNAVDKLGGGLISDIPKPLDNILLSRET